jgi:predicted small metal-binding protein
LEILIEEMMIVRYSCKDMGLKCSFVTKGDSLEDVTMKALDHVREKHPDDFNSFQTPEEIERMKQSLARSTRVVAE